MDTKVLTLTDFLLARIAEDEDAVEEARRDGADRRESRIGGYGHSLTYDSEYDSLCVGIRRGAADCEAKRRIVELHSESDPADCTPWGRKYGEPCTTLMLLALPYADHSDYREEWAV